MASFYITARKISPLTPLTIDAETRELAIQQVVSQAGEGEEVEVTSVQELPATAAAPAAAKASHSKS